MIRPDGVYVAPDPTPEMIELAKQHGYDPNNLAGSLPIWDLSADDTFAAAALLHDLGYVAGGTPCTYELLDANFNRDSDILADAVEGAFTRQWERGRGSVMRDIVAVYAGKYQHAEDYNTPITRAQSKVMADEAKAYINAKALKVDYPSVPYPEVNS